MTSLYVVQYFYPNINISFSPVRLHERTIETAEGYKTDDDAFSSDDQ